MDFEKFRKPLNILLIYVLPFWLGLIGCMIISYQAWMQGDKALACVGGVIAAIVTAGVSVCVKLVIEWVEARNALSENC